MSERLDAEVLGGSPQSPIECADNESVESRLREIRPGDPTQLFAWSNEHRVLYARNDNGQVFCLVGGQWVYVPTPLEVNT